MRRPFTPTVRQLRPVSLEAGDQLPAPRRSGGFRRALAAAGAIGPIAFLAVTVLAGLVKPGYRIGEQTVSDLAVGAYGWLQTANFFALGAAMVAFALALAMNGAPVRRSPTAVALLAAAGAGVIAAGLFPTDLAGAAETEHGVIHNMLFLAVFLALIAAYALQGRRLRRAGGERRLARYSSLTAVGVFLLLVVFVMFAGDLGDPLHDVAGLLERLLIGLALAWITVMSRRLLSTPSARGETV
jgi:hypothetical membrane protein